MLAQNLIRAAAPAPGPSGPPLLIGHVARGFDTGDAIGNDINAGNPIDLVGAGVQPGDTCIAYFSFDNSNDGSWNWAGLPFTAIFNESNDTNPGAYVGIATWTGASANPYITGLSSNRWQGLSMGVSVFRNLGAYLGIASQNMDDFPYESPGLSTTGLGAQTWFTTAHMDNYARTDLIPGSLFYLGGTTNVVRGNDTASGEQTTTTLSGRSSDSWNNGRFSHDWDWNGPRTKGHFTHFAFGYA